MPPTSSFQKPLVHCKKQEWADVALDGFLADWSTLVYSQTREQFETARSAFASKWRTSQAVLVDYVERTWLVHKEKIVRCWTDQHLHFGTTSTSRGEGNHFVVKRFLKIVNLDLLMVLKNLRLLLERQFTELNAQMESEKNVVAHRHTMPFMKPLLKRISKFALDKMLDQHRQSLDMSEEDACTSIFQQSYGIPCKHDIKRRIAEGRRFELSDIHVQWHLERNPYSNAASRVSSEAPLSPRQRQLKALQDRLYSLEDDEVPTFLSQLKCITESPATVLLNPEPVTRKRGRPAGSTNRANQRDKSEFEYASGYKCKICQKPGHNSRTCPEKNT
jgi:Zinc knuckle